MALNRLLANELSKRQCGKGKRIIRKDELEMLYCGGNQVKKPIHRVNVPINHAPCFCHRKATGCHRILFTKTRTAQPPKLFNIYTLVDVKHFQPQHMFLIQRISSFRINKEGRKGRKKKEREMKENSVQNVHISCYIIKINNVNSHEKHQTTVTTAMNTRRARVAGGVPRIIPIAFSPKY